MLRSVTINGLASRVIDTGRRRFHVANRPRPGWIRCAYSYVEIGPRGIGPERFVIAWAPGPIETAQAYADPIADAYARARWPGCKIGDAASDVGRAIYC